MKRAALAIVALVGLHVARGQGFVYVAHGDGMGENGGGGISVISTATNTVVAKISSGGGSASGVAISPDGKRAYVAVRIPFGNQDVDVIDTSINSVIATVQTPSYGGAGEVAVTPDGSRLYVSDHFSDIVSVIDTSTNNLLSTITVGASWAGHHPGWKPALCSQRVFEHDFGY